MRKLFKELLQTTHRARLKILLATVLAASAQGASVALLAVSAWLLARAAEMPPIMYLNVAVVGVRAFGISRGVLRYLERLVGHDIAFSMQTTLRLRTYRALSKRTLLGSRQGDLLTRLVLDVQAVLDLVVRIVIPACSAALVIMGTTLIVGRFNWIIGAILFGSAIIAAVFAPMLTAWLSKRADEMASDSRGRLGAQVHELERAAVDLVAYDAVNSELEQITATDTELHNIERRAAWARGAGAAVQALALGTAVCLALIVGGQAVADGSLAPRLLAVLALTPLALHETLGDLLRVGQIYHRARTSLHRVQEVLSLEGSDSVVNTVESDLLPAEKAKDITTDNAHLGARDLAIGWPGDTPILRDISFQVGYGQRLAVVGPSGVGKTTLAATVLGFLPPASGQLDVEGRIGYLAQDAHIFATTVAENLRIGRKDASTEELGDALTQAGVNLSLDRLIGERGDTLSGGEQRRLALARMLLGDFDAYILDEPTEHLDSETALRVMQDVWNAIGSRPVMVLTHDEQVIKHCTNVLYLRRLEDISDTSL